MVNTRSIAYDKRRSIISGSLLECLKALSGISTHSNLSNIYIAVAHSDLSKVFLLNYLTGSGKLSNRTCRSSLRSLTACIRINLCIKYYDINVLILSDYVVKTAKTDIVSPTVTAEDKLILLSGIVLILKEINLSIISLAVKLCIFESSNKRICSLSICCGIFISIKPSLSLC